MEERELLRILESAFIHLKKDVNYKETKRKYQQALEEIVALIQKPEIIGLVFMVNPVILLLRAMEKK